MLNLNFTQDISYHRRFTRLDLVHHLMGNGHLQAVVQVTENPHCRNALVLLMMNPDRFAGRPKSNTFTFHQQIGPELTSVALYADGNLYLPKPRQLACDLQYRLEFDEGVPTFRARYPADFTFQGERRKTAFHVEEEIICAMDVPAVLRRVRVTNSRGLEPTPARLFAFLVPNQALFPEAHYLKDSQVAIAGRFGGGDEFLAIAGLGLVDAHQVSEFPLPFEAATNGMLDPQSSQDDSNFVRPKERYTNYPLLPTSPHLGAVLALEFDLGLLSPGETRTVDLAYAYGPNEAATVNAIDSLRRSGYSSARDAVAHHWSDKNRVQVGEPRLDAFFDAMRVGLRASIGLNGSVNAGIWGFNSEWVRDSSLASVGASLSAQWDIARAILDHIIRDLFSPDGLAYGEGQFYDPRRHEPDQNGELLYALWMYWVHSRDDSLIREHWDKLQQIAEFPLRPEFWDKSAGMILSERDIRERDKERHGLKPGFELAYQMWVSLGLHKAADMARHMGAIDLGAGWDAQAKQLWDTTLNHPRFKLVENGYLMKRRLPDGSFQRHALSRPYVHRIADDYVKMYPRNLERAGELEPDHSEIYPIALGMLDPESDLAQRTLLRMEQLWNQEWDFGGYPLHHAGSEPTKLGSHMLPFHLITQAALVGRQYDTVRRNLNYYLTTYEGRGYTWWEYRDADPELQIDHGMIPWFVFSEPMTFFIHDLVGYRPGPDALTISPHLLPEMENITTHLRFGSHWVDLRLYNHGRFINRVNVDGKTWKRFDPDHVFLDVPQSDLDVEIWLEPEPVER
jgi:hypothetical protein